MEQLFRYSKKVIFRMMLYPLRVLRVKKNRILLHNDLGNNYSCNLKSIAEYITSDYPGQFEVIYSVKEPKKYQYLQNKGIHPIAFNSLQYFYYAMTSKVFVTNSGGHAYIPLRKRQYVINTHHGGGAYKTCGKDMFEDTYLFRKDLELSSKHTDVFLSTNSKFTEVVSNAIYMPKNVFWEIGMPRNDILINGNEELKKCIRKKIGLNDDEKLVLFAPTYRKIDNNYFKSSVSIPYGIDCDRVRLALHTRFGGNWRFAFRLHPRVENRDNLPFENVLDLSDYEDMQDLLLVADVMVNDFSSSMWDFMLTGRPSFLFAVDLSEYIQTTKVYTPVTEWPFPIATDNDGLEKNILSFDEDKYKKDCENHYKRLGGCETGKATELVCERIKEVCGV